MTSEVTEMPTKKKYTVLEQKNAQRDAMEILGELDKSDPDGSAIIREFIDVLRSEAAYWRITARENEQK